MGDTGLETTAGAGIEGSPSKSRALSSLSSSEIRSRWCHERCPACQGRLRIAPVARVENCPSCGGCSWRRAVGEAERVVAGAPSGGSVGGLLGGAASEVAVLEAVAVALEGEDLGVVDESVDHRDSDGVVAEDLAPRGEWLVGGDDQARAFVAAADEHEH